MLGVKSMLPKPILTPGSVFVSQQRRSSPMDVTHQCPRSSGRTARAGTEQEDVGSPRSPPAPKGSVSVGLENK